MDAALRVMANENPDMAYILLGDLDHGQHFLGAVDNPQEWIEGPSPDLPDGCEPKPGYSLVSRRNTRLFKEPVLDLIRDADLAFGMLMNGLEQGGYLEDAVVVLLSDHNMVNYLYRDHITDLTDVKKFLEDAGLAPEQQFFSYGAGSLGLLYWRPWYLLMNPGVVAAAKAKLLSPARKVYNHETGVMELPWGIMDRSNMIFGRPDLGIRPLEVYNHHFVKAGVWPDLLVVMKNGWQIPSGSFNLGGDHEFTLFNAGHGAPDTSKVMVAIRGLGYPAGAVCNDEIVLADVGETLATAMGWSFPLSVGTPLDCAP